jgi:hypothetical protein
LPRAAPRATRLRSRSAPGRHPSGTAAMRCRGPLASHSSRSHKPSSSKPG